MSQSLAYLLFDFSEDTDGLGVFDAMASTLPEQFEAVQAEAEQVLVWARQHFPQGPGPIDEGHDWDVDEQIQQENSLSGEVWHTLTLSLTGTPAFCEAFGQRFLCD